MRYNLERAASNSSDKKSPESLNSGFVRAALRDVFNWFTNVSFLKKNNGDQNNKPHLIKPNETSPHGLSDNSFLKGKNDGEHELRENFLSPNKTLNGGNDRKKGKFLNA